MKKLHADLLELLNASGASLYALLTRLTLRQDVAEELMQELFIKLSDSRRFAKAGNRDAYARRAAINLAFDWHRRQKQNPVRLDRIREPASSRHSPLSKLVRTEELEEILSAVGGLKGVCREAFIMRHIQQQSYDYIAGQLGKTPHQVRGLCSKALNHLRSMLGTNHQQSS